MPRALKKSTVGIGVIAACAMFLASCTPSTDVVENSAAGQYYQVLHDQESSPASTCTTKGVVGQYYTGTCTVGSDTYTVLTRYYQDSAGAIVVDAHGNVTSVANAAADAVLWQTTGTASPYGRFDATYEQTNQSQNAWGATSVLSSPQDKTIETIAAKGMQQFNGSITPSTVGCLNARFVNDVDQSDALVQTGVCVAGNNTYTSQTQYNGTSVAASRSANVRLTPINGSQGDDVIVSMSRPRTGATWTATGMLAPND